MICRPVLASCSASSPAKVVLPTPLTPSIPTLVGRSKRTLAMVVASATPVQTFLEPFLTDEREFCPWSAYAGEPTTIVTSSTARNLN